MDNELLRYVNLSWLPSRYSDLSTDLVIVITETVGGKRDSYKLTEMFLSLKLWLQWVCSMRKPLHTGLLQWWCSFKAARVLMQLQSTSLLALQGCFPTRSPLLPGLIHALLISVNAVEAPFASCHTWTTLLLLDCLKHMTRHPNSTWFHSLLLLVHVWRYLHLIPLRSVTVKFQKLKLSISSQHSPSPLSPSALGVCGSYSHDVFPIWRLGKIKSRPPFPCRGRADR